MRTTDEVVVKVRHRCPEFAFGTALGPGAMVTYWWTYGATLNAGTLAENLSDPWAAHAIRAAIHAQLGSTDDYRRHLDELAELP